jgi:hypothetical protein
MLPFISNNSLIIRGFSNTPTTTTIPPNRIRISTLEFETLAYDNSENLLVSTINADILTNLQPTNDISISNLAIDILTTDYL